MSNVLSESWWRWGASGQFICLLMLWALPHLPAEVPRQEPTGATPFDLELIVLDHTTRQPLEAECTVECEGSAKETTLSVVRTDPDGHCRIAVPEMRPEAFKLTVRKSGFARQVRVWAKTDTGMTIPPGVTIELSRGSTVGGIVQNSDGRRLPGVTLELMANADQIHPQGDPDLIASMKDTVTADAQGGWKSEGMPAEIQSLRVQVAGPLRPQTTGTWDRSTTTFPAFLAGKGVVRLLDNLWMEGVVTDISGRTIEGARVGEARGIDPPRPLAVTGSDGHFRADFRYWFDHLVDITVQASGYVPTNWSGQLKARMPALALRLDKGFTLRGRLVDQKNQPVANATVAIADSIKYQYHLPYNIQTETDDQGRFSFADLPCRPLPVDVWKPGMIARRGYQLDPATNEQSIVMIPLLRIHVSVAEEKSGQPINFISLTSAEIEPSPAESNETAGPYRWGRKEYLSALNGRYEYTVQESEVTGRRPLPRCVLRCEANGFLPAVSPTFKADEAQASWSVKLQQAPDLTGIIRTAEGVPAPNATFSFSYGAGGPVIRNGELDFKTPSTTDVEGRYRLPALMDFPVIVFHETGWLETNTRTLATNADMVLIPWGIVVGTYRAGTNPVAGQRLELRIRHKTRFFWRWSTTTDAAGHFQFARAPAGEVTVLSVGAIDPRTSGFSPVSEPITLKPGETVEVQAHDAHASGK